MTDYKSEFGILRDDFRHLSRREDEQAPNDLTRLMAQAAKVVFHCERDGSIALEIEGAPWHPVSTTRPLADDTVPWSMAWANVCTYLRVSFPDRLPAEAGIVIIEQGRLRSTQSRAAYRQRALAYAAACALLQELATDPPAVGKASSEATGDPLGEASYAAPKDIAERFKVKQSSLEQRLRRWRAENRHSIGFIANSDRKPRQPEYLYQISAIRHIIDALPNV